MTGRHLRALPDPADEEGMETSSPAPKPKRRRRYVRRKKDGTRTYPVRYTKPDGRVGQRTFYTAEAADAFRRKHRARKGRGVAEGVDDRITMEQLARKVGATVFAMGADKTQRMHEGTITNRLVPWAGDLRVTAWTRQDTKEFIAWIQKRGDVRQCRRPDGKPYGRAEVVPEDHPGRRPAGAATVRQAIQTGSILMQEAMEMGLRDDNPFSRPRTKPREEPAERRAFTMQELVLMGRACDALDKPMAKALIIMRAHCGIRMQDARALEWRDVDLERGWVTVRRAADHRGKIKSTKSGKEKDGRRTPLRGLGLVVMRQYHETVPVRRGLVFRNSRGGMVDHSNFRDRDWLPILECAALGLAWELAAAGVGDDEVADRCETLRRMKMHELRHTFPSIVGEAAEDIPMQIAMAWGGWKSPAMWARYNHLWDEASERAANALGDA